MNDEIQSYVFIELITFIIIVYIILGIPDALNSVIFVIPLLNLFFFFFKYLLSVLVIS